jgi:hypothetical protein
MSGCALRRWGAGTPCTREPDTAAKKEMADRLAVMRAEREKQDTMWLLPVAETPSQSLKPLPLKPLPLKPLSLKPLSLKPLPLKYTSS